MVFVVFFILLSSVCRADWKMDLVMINKPFLISIIPFSKTLLHSTTGGSFVALEMCLIFLYYSEAT